MSYKIDHFDEIAAEALRPQQRDLSIEETSYTNEYVILKDWFAGNEGQWTAQLVRLAGLAVYGWMPTILRAEGRNGKLRAVDFELVSVQLNKGRLARDHHNFLNGSFVGTSKFLHFWRPSEFAIWDSRIHKALKLGGSVNSVRNFDNYQRDIAEFCKQNDYDLRDVEVALFHKSGGE